MPERKHNLSNWAINNYHLHNSPLPPQQQKYNIINFPIFAIYMATDEPIKVEHEPQTPVEPPPTPPPAAVEVEEKPIVPVEPPVTEEPPVDDTKALAIVESKTLTKLFFFFKMWV